MCHLDTTLITVHAFPPAIKSSLSYDSNNYTFIHLNNGFEATNKSSPTECSRISDNTMGISTYDYFHSLL